MDSKTSGISVQATGTVSEAFSGVYRRKAGSPVLCRQFFAANALSFPMVEQDGDQYFVIDHNVEPHWVEEGGWIIPQDEDGAHFFALANEEFHAQYEMLDDFRSTTTHSDDPANPPDGIADDPDDIQAKLGHRAK